MIGNRKRYPKVPYMLMLAAFAIAVVTTTSIKVISFASTSIAFQHKQHSQQPALKVGQQ
jgi:uncharacterized membrane protein YfcA